MIATFGHPGIGSTPHLVTARLGIKEGVSTKIIPFAGDAPAPDAVSLDKAGYDVEHSVTVLIVGPKGMPPAVADRLEKAFADAMRTEPFVSVARKNELIVGDRLSGQALADHLRKVSAN